MDGKLRLVVLHHGQSDAAVAGEPLEFTGWGEPGLSTAGIEEAKQAGKKFGELGIKFDVVFTSMQPRAIHTAWLALMESENYSMPIVNSWRLNERNYGALQGLTSDEVEEKYGDELFQKFVSDFNVLPPEMREDDERHPSRNPKYKEVPQAALPNSESMANVCARVLPFWTDSAAPTVAGGMVVLICGHTGSIRALLKHIEGLKDDQVLQQDIPTGVPFVVEFDRNLIFVKRYWLFEDDVVQQRIKAWCSIPRSVKGGPRGRRATARQLAVTKSKELGFNFDVVVIGGGPVGLKAAEEAASRGQSVAIVDPKQITGVPTGAHSKCLREAALEGAKTWEACAHVLQTAMKNAVHEAARAIRTFHVKVFVGKGYVEDENTVAITDEAGVVKTVTTNAIVIATGSKANRFPPVNFDLDGVYDSDTFSTISRIPKYLVVQGAGIVSVEYALIFSKLGSKVTMIDAFPAFLPMLDEALQQACWKTLEQNGIEIIMSTPFKSVEAGDGSTAAAPKIKIDLGERQIECDALLSATGRHGLTYGLGLENLEAKGLKIAARGKMIEVNHDGYTSCASVYAVGDCATGSMGLATMGQAQAVRAMRVFCSTGIPGISSSKKQGAAAQPLCQASRTWHLVQGIGAMRAMASIAPSAPKQEIKPFGVWTIPDIAWAGMSEAAAKKAGINYGVSQVQYKQTTRGCVTDENGFLKMVFDRDTGVVLGVHIWGENSCELINYGAQICETKATIYEVLNLVFPAVTYHMLYTAAATEAKIRLAGARNLAAATAWKRMQDLVNASIAGTAVTMDEFLNRAFQVFDEDKSGFLTKDELKKAVESMGIGATEDDIADMIEEATGDPEEDNVDYQTFVNMLSTSQVASNSAEEEPQEEQPQLPMTKSVTCVFKDVSRTALDKGDRYDLVVIGAGPAGIAAAQEAGARGKRTAIIDTKPVVTGIPTGAHSKCLREAVLEGAKTWEAVQKVLEKAGDNAHGLAIRKLKTFHVAHLKGSASVKDINTVSVKLNDSDDTRELTTDKILIATGSKANRFPPTNFDLPGVYDSDTISSITRKPDVLVCQGAGIASVEYGIMFAMMGTKVILVEAFPTFLGMMDCDMRQACKDNLDKYGVELLMNTKFQSVEAGEGSTPESPKIKIDIGERVLECDMLFSATGRHGLTYGLGLEALADKGLTINPRGKLLKIDDLGWTGCGGIYAAGDCAEGSMGLATMGMRQAVVAVRAMFSVSGDLQRDKKSNFKEIKPSGVWTIPELAWAGISEDKAKADGINYATALVPFKKTVRGCVSNQDGFLKLVFSKDNARIMGVHLCGENACELVNYGAEIINANVTIFEVLHFVFPAVTYHMLYNKAATEAKIRLRGAKNVNAAMAWKRMQRTVERSLELSGSKESVHDALEKAFVVFDTDSSGFLTKDELYNAIISMGLKISEEDVSAMIAEAVDEEDYDEEQGIDYETFLKMLS